MTDLIEHGQQPINPGVMPSGATGSSALGTSVRAIPSTARTASPSWERPYLFHLLVADSISAGAAMVLASLTQFGTAAPPDGPFYLVASLVVMIGWLTCLYVVRAYEIRRIATAAREFQRVLNGSINIAGITAIVAFLGHFEVARPIVVVGIPIGAGLMVIGRCVIRRNVHRHRLRGKWTNRILAIGTPAAVRQLVAVTQRNPFAGLVVIGACVEDGGEGDEIAPGVPNLGDVDDAAEVAEQVGANIVAVAGSGMSPQRVRELGWALEGTGRNMVMAPGLTDVAGPRLHVSPVEGLPLMWVDQPQFAGVARFAKRAMDIIGASILLLIGTPFLLVTGLLVRLTSRGPALYRSTRMGEGGREFTVFKFRSMYVGSDLLRSGLAAQNDADGLLFKIRQDPRVTPVGRTLRKFSIDELPQLINVLGGSMSLVGPRPPLPDEVSRYDKAGHRRLLVKPGMTGLWQVSGRSNLPWEESLRLDLYYVENWSLALDLTIIGRTMWAVVRGHGAY